MTAAKTKRDSFEILVEFPARKVADLLVTAFEGGIYGVASWGQIVGSQRPKSSYVRYHGQCYSDYPLSDDGNITIKDVEEGKIHILDLKAILRGLHKFPMIGSHHFANWVCEKDDAITGEVFVQLCLFGEHRYS